MPLLSCTIFHTQCSFPTNPATVSLLDGYREYAFTFAHEMREEMTKLLAQGFKVWWPSVISYTPFHTLFAQRTLGIYNSCRSVRPTPMNIG